MEFVRLRFFFLRADKYNTAKIKLFFPLPMDPGVHEDDMQQVWHGKYVKKKPYPARWNWKVNFMKHIQCEKVASGMLRLDCSSGMFREVES